MQKFIKLLTAFLLLFPLMALGQTDTTYLFQFVPAKDMFFMSYCENASRLQRLSEALNRNRAKIVKENLKEVNFLTHNHAIPYGEMKDVVIISLRIPKHVPIVSENVEHTKHRGNEKTETTVSPITDTNIVPAEDCRRYMDFVELERQEPSVCSVGSKPGYTLLYRYAETCRLR